MSVSSLCIRLASGPWFLICFFKRTFLRRGFHVEMRCVPSVPSPSQFPGRPGTPPKGNVTSFFLSPSISPFLGIARNNTRRAKNNLTVETGNENGPIPSHTAAQAVSACERCSLTWRVECEGETQVLCHLPARSDCHGQHGWLQHSHSSVC